MAFSRDFYFLLCGEEKGLRGGGGGGARVKGWKRRGDIGKEDGGRGEWGVLWCMWVDWCNIYT